jgi:hypothetical protein
MSRKHHKYRHRPSALEAEAGASGTGPRAMKRATGSERVRTASERRLPQARTTRTNTSPTPSWNPTTPTRRPQPPHSDPLPHPAPPPDVPAPSVLPASRLLPASPRPPTPAPLTACTALPGFIWHVEEGGPARSGGPLPRAGAGGLGDFGRRWVGARVPPGTDLQGGTGRTEHLERNGC